MNRQNRRCVGMLLVRKKAVLLLEDELEMKNSGTYLNYFVLKGRHSSCSKI